MSFLRDADTVAISPARGLRGADPVPSEDGTWPAGSSFGPYVILEPIGRGGQGTVYRAHDTRLRRQVALKLLGGFSRNSEVLVQRFRREAEMASRLEHPGLCSVLDAGVDHGVPYIVMRHVAGMTLAERIARAGIRNEPLDPAGVREVVLLIEQAARALQSAHESGIVHRDIKPGNLMVTPEMGAVVLDFGVARDLAAPEAAFTVAGEIFGTPAYMAPEQLAGSATTPDARCDVYALGVTLYEALTLRRPFTGPDGEGLRQAILHAAPADPRMVVPAVSRDLKIVIDTALAKDPGARYATAAAFADDLRAVLEARPISARAASVASRVARWVKREPAKAALTAVLALGIPLVAALVGFVVARYPDVELARRLRFDLQLAELLQEAFLEVQEGSAEAALVGFRAALERDRERSETLAGYGLALLRTGRTDDALAFLRGDPRRRGRESLFDRILASGLYELGRYEEARAIDVRLGPGRDELECFVAGLIDIARSHGYEPGAAVRAVAHLERAVLLAERPRAIYFYALAHAANHARDAGAVRRAAVAIESHWGDAWQSWFWVATSHEWLDAEKSLAAYAKTLALKPDFGRALVAMAEVHRHHGRDAEARDHLERALAANPLDPGVHDTAAHIYLDLGDAERAIAARRRSVELYPVSLSYRTAFVRLLRSRGRLAEARQEADALLALDPRRAQSLQMHAEVLFAEGREDEAVAAAEAGISASPDDPRILNDCGLVLLDSGRFEAAGRAFDHGVSVAPVLEQLHLNRLMLAKATNDFGLALDEHERWAANFPTSPVAREALLTHLVEIDRLEVWRDREALAAAVSDALARVGDKDAALMVAVARARRVLGERDAARSAAERAVALGLSPEQRARLDPILGPAPPPK